MQYPTLRTYMVIQLNMDLTKIDKSRIKPFTRKNGEQGKGYDVVIFLNDQPDEHGNYGFAATSTGKDEPRGSILGNVKIAGNKTATPISAGQSNGEGDDEPLPF